MPDENSLDETLASLSEMQRGFAALKRFTDSTALYLRGNYPLTEEGELSYLSLGLAGESGEAVDCVKKIIRAMMVMPEDATRVAYINQQKAKLSLELGDVFWYLTRLCHAIKLDPAIILQGMVLKLSEREAAGTLAKREG